MKNPWIRIKKSTPEDEEPCEYVIEVLCKGWVKYKDKEITFLTNEKNIPSSKIVKWRKWSTSESYKQALEKNEKKSYEKVD